MTLSVDALETGLVVAYGIGTSFAAPHVAGTGALHLGKSDCVECFVSYVKGLHKKSLSSEPVYQAVSRKSNINSTVRGAG